MPAFILCLDDHAALASTLAEQLSQQQPVSVLPLPWLCSLVLAA